MSSLLSVEMEESQVEEGPNYTVLEEEVDPNYVPSENEVTEYAKWLGMNLETDRDLFWIARDGLVAALPNEWKPCSSDDIYYFNFTTGESTWDHPCDICYKRLYVKEKKKKEDSSDIKTTQGWQLAQEILGNDERYKRPKKVRSLETGLSYFKKQKL